MVTAPTIAYEEPDDKWGNILSAGNILASSLKEAVITQKKEQERLAEKRKAEHKEGLQLFETLKNIQRNDMEYAMNYGGLTDPKERAESLNRDMSEQPYELIAANPDSFIKKYGMKGYEQLLAYKERQYKSLKGMADEEQLKKAYQTIPTGENWTRANLFKWAYEKLPISAREKFISQIDNLVPKNASTQEKVDKSAAYAFLTANGRNLFPDTAEEYTANVEAMVKAGINPQYYQADYNRQQAGINYLQSDIDKANKGYHQNQASNTMQFIKQAKDIDALNALLPQINGSRLGQEYSKVMNEWDQQYQNVYKELSKKEKESIDANSAEKLKEKAQEVISTTTILDAVSTLNDTANMKPQDVKVHISNVEQQVNKIKSDERYQQSEIRRDRAEQRAEESLEMAKDRFTATYTTDPKTGEPIKKPSPSKTGKGTTAKPEEVSKTLEQYGVPKTQIDRYLQLVKAIENGRADYANMSVEEKETYKELIDEHNAIVNDANRYITNRKDKLTKRDVRVEPLKAEYKDLTTNEIDTLSKQIAEETLRKGTNIEVVKSMVRSNSKLSKKSQEMLINAIEKVINRVIK